MDEILDDNFSIEISPVIDVSPNISIVNIVGDHEYSTMTDVPTNKKQQTVPGVSKPQDSTIDSGDFIKALGSIASLIGSLVREE